MGARREEAVGLAPALHLPKRWLGQAARGQGTCPRPWCCPPWEHLPVPRCCLPEPLQRAVGVSELECPAERHRRVFQP